MPPATLFPDSLWYINVLFQKSAVNTAASQWSEKQASLSTIVSWFIHSCSSSVRMSFTCRAVGRCCSLTLAERPAPHASSWLEACVVLAPLSSLLGQLLLPLQPWWEAETQSLGNEARTLHSYNSKHLLNGKMKHIFGSCTFRTAIIFWIACLLMYYM